MVRNSNPGFSALAGSGELGRFPLTAIVQRSDGNERRRNGARTYSNGYAVAELSWGIDCLTVVRRPANDRCDTRFMGHEIACRQTPVRKVFETPYRHPSVRWTPPGNKVACIPRRASVNLGGQGCASTRLRFRYRAFSLDVSQPSCSIRNQNSWRRDRNKSTHS